MPHFVAIDGRLKGYSWPITAQGLHCGRAVDCDVPIDDPAVSRNHCRIADEEEGLFLYTLAANNTTLVNAEPVQNCRLSVSDVVAIGSATFIVSSSAGGPAPQRSVSTEAKTSPLFDWNDFLLADSESEKRGFGFPRTPREMADLFALGRRLASAGTLKDFLQIAVTDLAGRFRPQELWIVHHHEPSDSLRGYPLETPFGNEAPRMPEKLIRRAIASGKAAVRYDTPDTGPQSKRSTTFVAPISLNVEHVGAIAITEIGNCAKQDDWKLKYLTAVAQQMAPLLTLFEKADRLKRDNEKLRSVAGHSESLIGTSRPMGQVRSLIRKAAFASLNVLITGETGTGKELTARLIHELSPQADGPFVVVNSAAIPPELFEGELFGYEAGAYTGATTRKIGRIQSAQGGTLFLDEIGDLSLDHQGRILRVIENRTLQRIGATQDVHLNIRILAATNKDLRAAMENGTFRADVFHRLHELEVHLPPLRKRRADIPLLAEHFFRLMLRQTSRALSGFDPEAVEFLCRQPWPGNIRELRACVQRAVVLAQNDTIGLGDLQLRTPASQTDGETLPTLAQVEKRHIVHVLKECGGKTDIAAKVLNIARSTLYNKIALYGIVSR